MKNHFKMRIINSLLIFTLACSLLSCDQYDDNEKDGLEIPERSASAEPGTIKASISPGSGSTLTTSTVTFSWDHPSGYFYLDIGNKKGGTDLFTTKDYFQSDNYTVNNLPDNGTIYLRLWYYTSNGWVYNDYTYTMDVGGNSSKGMEPADGSTLTKSSVLFNWTHTADYYRIYLGTSVAGNDLYDSGNLSSQNNLVTNIPESGTVYLRLWLHKNGSWSEKYDYTYTAQVDGGTPSGDKDFIITWVNDNLNPEDATIFANGLKGLGYSQTLDNSNVSSNELKDYLGRDLKTLYHTGHGSPGYISTSNGGLYLSSINSVAVENLIVATCLTMKDKEWKNKFESRTKNIMGYTNYSYDNVDDRVATNVTDLLGNGKSYLQAWYESNNKESYLNDRWCCYTREGSSIVEYSATSGNNPKSSTSGSFYSLANGKVQVSSNIGNNVKSSSLQSISKYNATEDQLASTSSQDFNALSACSISSQTAVNKAQDWISSRGSFSNAEFDKAVTLTADGTIIGYQIRFKRVINSLPVRGNGLVDYVSLLVTDNDIVTTQYHWSSISSLAKKSAVNVLNPTQAIKKAANSIASLYKGDQLKITQAVPCLGFKTTGTGSNKLVPAYEFISDDGLGIVVDAATGSIL